MKATYEKLGIPEAERKYLAGVTAQYEVEVVYHRNREELERQGILFSDMDTALREYPDLVRQYFGTVIPPGDNKFAALNSSVWSGGSFIYVPPGVEVEMPLQAYFRINSENAGQFERTLIIADEGAKVHYIEGCSAPVYTNDSLHSAVVEIVVKPSARVTYTTIQNWSPNVYNLVTKRARVEAEGHMEWIDGNIGCWPRGRPSRPAAVSSRSSWSRRARRFSRSTTMQERCAGGASLPSGALATKRCVRSESGNAGCASPTTIPFLFLHATTRTGRRSWAATSSPTSRADHLAHAIVPNTSLDCGEPHKLERPELKTEFVGANQYRVGLVPRRRERSTRLSIPETTTTSLLWLFGLYVGDGSIESEPAANGGHRWARVVFSVPGADRARKRLDTTLAGLAPTVAAPDAVRRPGGSARERRARGPARAKRFRWECADEARTWLGAPPARGAAGGLRGRLSRRRRLRPGGSPRLLPEVGESPAAHGHRGDPDRPGRDVSPVHRAHGPG